MRKLIALVVLMLAFSAHGFAAGITGTWELSMTNQMGQTETWTLDIKADGGNLAINAVHPMFGNVAGTGTISGSDVTMHMVVAGGIGKVVTDFEGKLTGDKMEGTRKVSYDHSEDASSEGGGAPGGDPGGAMPAGGGGAPGAAPEGGAPGGGGPGGSGGAPEGGGPGGDGGGGAPAGDIPDTWTAVRK